MLRIETNKKVIEKLNILFIISLLSFAFSKKQVNEWVLLFVKLNQSL